MSFIKVEDGKSFYCEARLDQPAEIVEGIAIEQPVINLGGIFTVCGGGIRLKLVCFDHVFHVPNDAVLVVRTEANWTASLFDMVSLGTGQHGHTDRVAYRQDFLVNTALIGWDRWTADDRVLRTRFRVPDADFLLRHRPTFAGLSNSHIIPRPKNRDSWGGAGCDRDEVVIL
jgi:hypothetical protein